MPAEQLLLINPRRRKTRSGKRRVKRARRPNPVAHRRRRRRNPVARRASGYVIGKGRIRRRRLNPRRRHARRRNPFTSTQSLMSGILVPAAIGAAGAAAVGYAYSEFSSYLPTSLTGSALGVAAVEGAAAVGLGLLTGKLIGRQEGVALAAGALAVVLYTYIDTQVTNFGGNGLQGVRRRAGMGNIRRRNPGIGAYLPGQGLGGVKRRVPRMGGINRVRPNRVGMGAYMPGQGLGGISNFNPAPMLAGMRGVCNYSGSPVASSNPGLAFSDSMF